MFRTPMTLDRGQRRLTILAIFLLLAVGVGVASYVGERAILAASIVALALVLSWAMAPRELVVDSDEIRILRRAWPALCFPRSDVESAAPIDKLGKKAARLWGVGGFFGSYGLFWSDKLGRFRLYATRRGQAVVVVRKGKLLPLVITPDDVAGTIAAIDPRAPLVHDAGV